MYWLWRDRKGLIASPLSVLSNAVFLYGLATMLWTRLSSVASHLAIATAPLLLLRTGIRMACVSRIYTDLAVIDVTPEGLTVRDVVPGLSVGDLAALSKVTLVDGRKAPVASR